MAKPELIFVGIRGSVVAINRTSGSRVWEAPLKGRSFVTVIVDGDRVLAGTQGEVFCLNAATGEIVWHDGLKGYGLGLVSLATKNAALNPAVLAAEQKQQEDAASSSTAVAS